MADGPVQPDGSDPLFAAGLDSMKASTRQYAKRQVKWITGKLLPEVRKDETGDVTVVLLDATGELARAEAGNGAGMRVWSS